MEEDMLSLERRMHDAVDRLAGRLEKMQETITDVRERLIRIESSSVQHLLDNAQTQLAELSKKVEALEGHHNTAVGVKTGVSTTAEWAARFAPWITMVIVTVAINWRSFVAGG
jgi:chromosome segregation ATPase